MKLSNFLNYCFYTYCLFSLTEVCLFSTQVHAQIIPDHTLGSESSVVTTDVIKGIDSDRIDGGAIRGSNLFQSFQEFNVGEGRGAYFSNPSGIANIFSRVTGGNISQIMGTLGVLGNANLYFLNPNGILFGPNAQLDIKGSFLATNADSFQFPNSYAFSAVNPDIPPLLTVNIPLGLNFRANSPATITNQGNLIVSQDLTLSGSNLQIQGQLHANKNLFLDSQNNINIQDNLTESLGMGGNIEINALGDININNSKINVDGRDHSGITINGNNLNIKQSNIQVEVGIDDQLKRSTNQSGDIKINVNKMSMNDSILANIVPIYSQGNAGNIIIHAHGLSLQDGAKIDTSTYGKGESGVIHITAQNITLIGENSQGFPSSLSSRVEKDAVGNSGGIIIDTNTLSLQNAARIDASTFGRGNAGVIKINAQAISLFGESSKASVNPFLPKVSTIFSGVLDTATGSNGSIIINTNSLSLKNGSMINASTNTKGNGGVIQIHAQSILLMGESIQKPFTPLRPLVSGIFSGSVDSATGNSGNIIIDTDSLSLQNGARISATTFGEGDAGIIQIKAKSIDIAGKNRQGLGSSILSKTAATAKGNSGGIVIETNTLSLQNEAQINAGTDGKGNAGKVKIQAKNISLTNKSNISTNTLNYGNSGSINIDVQDKILIDQESQISSNVESQAKGNATGIYIDTDSLIITNGGRISSDTYGKGNAGNVEINARKSILVDGEGQLLSGKPPYRLPSIISSVVFPDAEGNAKGISINTGSLKVTNGGIITSSTLGKGDANNVNIKANDSILLEGKARDPQFSIGADNVGYSGIFTLVLNRSSGHAGNISIAADSLQLSDGGTVNASTTGSGNAGVIVIDTNSLNLEKQTAISSIVHEGATGMGGDILIKVNKSLSLNNAQIRAFTQGTGNAGSIFIDSPQATIHFSNDSNASVASGLGAGAAGNLAIKAKSLNLDQSSLTAETYNNLQLSGANIDLNLSDRLTLTNDSKITATAFKSANGGNIQISSPFLIASPSTGANGNDIIAKAFLGNGGKIQIDAQGIFGITEEKAIDGNHSNDIDASSEFGASGVVQINRAIDPNRGLVSLPVNVVDPNALISQNPCKRGKESQLTVKGRGELPHGLTEDFSSTGTEVNWVEAVPMSNNPSNPEKIESNTEIKPRIEPAQGWIFNEKGQVMLIGYNTKENVSERSPLPDKGCPAGGVQP